MKKFKDRATAVSRIWKAIQNLGHAAPAAEEPAPAPVAGLPETVPGPDQEANETAKPEGPVSASRDTAPATTFALHVPDVAPQEPAAKKKATREKKPPVTAPAKDVGAAREGSKTSAVIAMLKREGGTTLEEIMTAMGWQKHTTRAMLSAGGSIRKNHGLVVTSEKVGDKRTYSIKS